MRLWVFCCAALTLSWSLPSLAAPLEAYGRLANLEDVQISPDGANLAFVMTNGEDRKVLVERLSDRTPIGGLNAGQVKLRSLQWADAQHLIITTSVTGLAAGVITGREEWYLAQVYDLAHKHPHPLLNDLESSMNVIAASPEVRTIDGHAVVFFQGVHFNNGEGDRALFRTDLTYNHSGIVNGGNDLSADWLVDAAGVPVAEARYDQLSAKWTLRIRKTSGSWMESRSLIAPTARPTLAGLGRDGKSVVVELYENGQMMMHEVSLIDGDWGKGTLDPYRSLIFDPVTHALIGGEALSGDAMTTTFFEPKLEKVWTAITKAFPSSQVSLASFSDDRRKIVVLVDTPGDGPAYALVDMNTGHADWIGRLYPAVRPDDVGEVKPVSYKAADGLAISGYLTLPHGKPAKNLPLVLLPHGGPEARDEPGFDWWAQAVASRGYAVLQVNFRGSSGFGSDFVASGYGQWGRKMQTDLSDGVRYLASQGIIDPKRVCIFGGSYGGYAALAGATLDPGVYRCAVSLAGPSDLRRMLRFEQADQRSQKNETLRYWDQFMGAKGDNDVGLDAISPSDQAAKATIPILLIHGKDDTVVPFAQSQIMADSLARAGRPATLVTLKGEDHWLSRGDTRLQMLTAAMSFIEANNPPN